MQRIIGAIGLAGVLGLYFVGPSSTRVLSASALESVSGSAFTCQNPALVNSNCNQCLSNGNGGSVFCLNNPQGYSLTPYTNPVLHYGHLTHVRTSPCGGYAYNFPFDEACTYGAPYDIVLCGRTYPDDYISGGEPTACP